MGVISQLNFKLFWCVGIVLILQVLGKFRQSNLRILLHFSRIDRKFNTPDIKFLKTFHPFRGLRQEILPPGSLFFSLKTNKIDLRSKFFFIFFPKMTFPGRAKNNLSMSYIL